MSNALRKNSGVTLTELLIALALTGIVAGAIYNIFISQGRAYTIQSEVAEMQQNLRAGIFMVEREIRMVGYDPTRAADAEILTAAPDHLEFTADLNGDGDTDDPNEHMIYTHYDTDADGTSDALGRDDVNSGAGTQLLAENIDQLNYVYLDGSRNALNDMTTSVDPVVLPDIRSIQVTMVARSGVIDSNYTNNETYQNQNPGGSEVIYTAPGDNFRRRLLSTEIKCRNLGL
ncbi:MAG: prepilin-type N-terminal cleavage/methylation domain-containing protein [Deltaproteobacteria bacterium]|nr:prepilin-type N-terminal cleavage/methylation domain-containing protein [Desulfobacteraceae bacterium]MDH3898458.1 prepilin-type N-terminal cleavage/methylation domain-containing protein [Deltaproteobacteria bacterium]MDH3964913.1 prepilin-type N-terminal cleavage/methylation domain-containing protein [Deltaproteobacteria bacterium]